VSVEERKRNWVAEQGGLPEFIDHIAKHLQKERGMTMSHSIAVAVNAAKKMCRDEVDQANWPGPQHVNAASRAQACAAVQQWEQMRVAAKASSALRRAERSEVMEDYELEQRTVDVDVTDLDTRGRTVVGYAAVYGSRSADLGGFTEQIAPGAFRDVLAGNPDVRALLNHDPNQILGRTKSGTLRLYDEERGLRFEIDLPDSPLGENVRAAVERRDLDGASFRFKCGDDEWDGDVRTVKNIRELHDCSLATTPAYPSTSIELRTRPTKEDEMEERSNGAGLAVEDRAVRPDENGDIETRIAESFRSVRKGESRTLTTDDASGGAITPPELSTYIFDHLVPRSVALTSGIRVIPTDRHTINWPTVVDDPDAAWVAETDVIPASDPVFGALEAEPKKLATRVEFSNEVLDDSVPDAGDVVRRLMLRALASKLDLSIFEGNPTADPESIKGLKYQAGIQTDTVLGANGGAIPAGADGLDLITDALGLLEDADVPGPYAIVMLPSIWRQIRELRDGQSRRLLPPGTTSIEGATVYTTTRLSSTETRGTSTDTSSIYIYSTDPDVGPILVRRQDVVVDLDRSRLFDKDMSELRAKTRVDFIVPQPQAVVRIVGVRPA
jgi:HK97 family phage major capsid protein/HK97 family phage prohead protease